MGQKVNFNNSNKKKNKMKINMKITIIVVLIFLCGLLILIQFIKNKNDTNLIDENEENKGNTNNILTYQTIGNYKNLEDLIRSYNCTYIKDEKINDIVKIYLTFDMDLYTNNISNETHFLNIAKGVASFLKYENFDLIDSRKNIHIEIKCQEPNIVEFKINDDINYYLNHNSNLNKNLSKRITNFTIQSRELQQLIDGNWIDTNVDWGTKDSTCNGYNIYFDEGIEYKNVSKNVFNVIFTEKYDGQVAGGLTVTSSPEMVKSALGEPSFSDGDNIYGYVSENNYLFFDFSNQEISVYPVVNVTKDEETKLRELIEKMNETSDIKRFGTDLISFWLDYDTYNYDSNYIELKYALKGFEVSINSNSLKNGIFIYQNYSGDKNISELENVYVKDEDFVFNTEKDRGTQEILNRIEEGEFEEEYYNNYLGVDFSIRFDSENSDAYKGVKFYSRNKEYEDSEFDRNLEISSYIWYDENKLIYSVNDDGIYLYNCVTKVNVKIIDVEGEIIINSAKDEQIIYNDKEILNVSIQ